MHQVNLKLAPDVGIDAGSSVVAETAGVFGVRQVFPDEHDDDDLRRMFVVDIDPANTEATLSALRELTCVAEVELAPLRRVRPPIRSRER